MVRMVNSGTEATMSAIRLARAATGRDYIVKFEGCYHGHADSFLVKAGSGALTLGVPNSPGVPAALADLTLTVPFNVLPAVHRCFEEHSGEIAAVIVEPLLLGAGGMRMWEAEDLRAIRALTREREVLLIADEVLTGFGRTGPLFASGGAGVEPDLLCLSKGLTGGFLPLGVTAATEELFEAFRSPDRRKTLFHGHSYTANPIACAAARATLSLLDEDCAAKRADIENIHRSHMARLAAHPRVKSPRVLGTVAAFDLGGEAGYLAEAGPALHRFALAEGVLLRPLGNVVYLLPPYCVSADDLDHAYQVIEKFMEGA
jgi:adenosylmethionine-8-amino-7-oxononanoate aminotransferase